MKPPDGKEPAPRSCAEPASRTGAGIVWPAGRRPRSGRSEAPPSRPPDVPHGAGRAHRALALFPASVLGAAIIAAYATTIVIAAAHHELWRDEVVPLSIAREMPSFSEVWRMVRHEGHPILWYVILRYSYFVFGSTAVLPVASVLIAIAAIAVFVTQARLPLWLKALFVFGYIPIFEYSVLARANGLAMLLLFAFCALYAARERYRISAAL